jgi:hypothetical protein
LKLAQQRRGAYFCGIRSVMPFTMERYGREFQRRTREAITGAD